MKNDSFTLAELNVIAPQNRFVFSYLTYSILELAGSGIQYGVAGMGLAISFDAGIADKVPFGIVLGSIGYVSGFIIKRVFRYLKRLSIGTLSGNRRSDLLLIIE